MTDTTKTRRVHYVLSTHWDREWYESFQYYRFRLVQLLDRVLDGLEEGRLKGPFQTDGQSIILEDYLDIRPERREQIERFAREGKLVIGPWYILPDEFIVSGESHLRNIRLGREIARSFGTEPSNAGFACDLFGHISQLPQIFAGFSLKAGFAWRGINLTDTRAFIWTGADGTEMPTYKFPGQGYADFSFKVRESNQPDKPFDAKEKAENLDRYLEKEAADTEIGPILFFDGLDHQEWDEPFYKVIEERFDKEVGGYQYIHSSLDQFIDEFLSEADQITPRLEGELREVGRDPKQSGHVIPGVISSRVWIKLWNSDCETKLLHWAEPLCAYAHRQTGIEDRHGFFDLAWRYLIKNHPHDSICGCSIDQVHEDMKFRFSQCEQIADRLKADAMRKLGANIEGDVGEDEVRVVVFNPLSERFQGVADLNLDIPEDYPEFREYFGYEPKPAFKIFDTDGNEIPYQRDRQAMGRMRLRVYDDRSSPFFPVNEVAVSIDLDIPAQGYTTLVIRPGEKGQVVRYPQDTGLATGPRTMENETLSVRIENNGTLTLTDKRNGEVYTDLLTFEDKADIGDGWFHGLVVNDEIHMSSACHADIALLDNGPRLSRFRVRTTMRLPAGFDFQNMLRTEERREFTIDTVLTLRKGADHLEAETRIDNNVKNHRLRVLFPTRAEADHYETDTPFDAIRRPVKLREDNHLYFELDTEPRPMRSWVAVADGRRGMAIVSSGQLESCVSDLEERPIALTLFRATGRTVGTNGEPGGQLQQELAFRYHIRPLAGGIDRPSLFRHGVRLAAGLGSIQLRRPDQLLHRRGASLPHEAAYLELDGPAILTSSRDVGDAFEVRVFNPLEETTESTLKLNSLAPYFTSAVPVDFESKEMGGKVALQNGEIAITLGAKKIQTLRLT